MANGWLPILHLNSSRQCWLGRRILLWQLPASQKMPEAVEDYSSSSPSASWRLVSVAAMASASLGWAVLGSAPPPHRYDLDQGRAICCQAGETVCSDVGSRAVATDPVAEAPRCASWYHHHQYSYSAYGSDSDRRRAWVDDQ